MQIVIDIPDEKYDRLMYQDIISLRVYIENGIVLPKGHGRLIDADEFRHTLEDMPIRDTDKWFNWLQKACIRLAEAPTIIEADRSDE